MRTAPARRITALLLAAAFLAGCADEPADDGNPVPYTYLSSEYTPSGADYVDAVDQPSTVADEIHGHSSATERLDSEDKVFLRYRDDIVAISPFLTGSRIEVADYRTGHKRWKSHLRSWPDPDSASFRGGGPGSGK
ncbi:DUF4247 domain-containing protein [Streptomyces thermolilacinus]|uniref:DUF4247 domain-containing protein n=1 Tax=Streptomyces thermolilacinus SPC6 TaxID=1306406 RepID=A0A1D3DZ12_9ACTN|nr:DUF4247 domain-containing protein [Streptomyces thermolilacinus]OEJ97554.1 hypothetical protein J116_026965 [Streptomyces thermolilacinus SPC6]